jgi:hypothetical protein
MANPGTFSQKSPVPPHLHHQPPSKGVMVPAEGGTCSTDAFVKDLDLVTIDRGKDLPAGTLGKC